MIGVLFLIPLLMAVSIIYLYRFSGRKLFLHFDLVQFVYAFVIYPAGYVWLKNFLYFIFRDEVGVSMSVGQWMTVDAVFTVLFLYFYAFGIIHSLTKTFSLQMERDPLFDLFHQSEYFHEFLSHVGMYVGLLFLLTILGVINVFLPLEIVAAKTTFYFILLIALLGGMLAYIGAFYTTDKGIGYSKYSKLLKLSIAGSFLLHVLLYFRYDPRFNISFAVFWFGFGIVTALVLTPLFINPTRRLWKILEILQLDKGID